MAGYRSNAYVDSDVLLALREALTTDRTKVRRVFFMAITRSDSAAEKARRELSKEPPPAVHPIEWTSPKQRRYVMMKLREQNNLPYRRTHRQSTGWRVTVDSPLDVLFSNSNPAAQFVQGLYQQKFHANTGWPYAPVVIASYSEAITDELATAYLRFVVGYKR